MQVVPFSLMYTVRLKTRSISQKCREAVAGANPHTQINFKGPIAHTEIFKTLKDYHLFFLPTQGENFGHIIFEALTSGCVVLISDKTPWKGLEQKNAGWALPLNDNRNFAQKIKEMCELSEDELNVRSKAAFEYAKQYLLSTNLKRRYADLFQSN